jgi:hypothetical protein
MLTEIYLCHACAYHEIEDGNGAPGGTRVASWVSGGVVPVARHGTVHDAGLAHVADWCRLQTTSIPKEGSD